MIISSSLLLVVAFQLSYGQECDDTALRRFDSTYAKLLTLGGSGRKFPEDKGQQLRKYCDDSFEYLNNIDKYKNKCMKQMPKQTTGVMVHGIRKVINKYCKRDSKALTDLIASTPCPNRAKKEWDYCYTQLIDNFQGAYNAKEKLRIPHVCCDYHRFHECVRAKSENHKDCTEFQTETMSNWIKEIFDSTVDLLCSDYTEGSDKCDKLGPSPKKKKSQRRTKSFMLPLVDSLASLPEA